MNNNGNKRKKQAAKANLSEQQALKGKVDEIEKGLVSKTWRELETKGKFGKNDKLAFTGDEKLIVGCDVGSEKHFARAIDNRGRELSDGALAFSNNLDGFLRAKEWMLRIAASHGKDQIVLGFEPTGHYGFALARWMTENGISVVQVNAYAVKQTKELEDNIQLKDDRKDPKVIANLVKNGDFGMPYLPEGPYANLRCLSVFRDQLKGDVIRSINRLHRMLKEYFPEYKEALGDVAGSFSLELLKAAPLPEDLLRLGEAGIRQVWLDAKLRGSGYSRTQRIIKLAKESVGVKDGAAAAGTVIRWLVDRIVALNKELDKVEEELYRGCKEIPNVENIAEIPGIGRKITSGIIAEIGDISRFDSPKEIQKLSGLALVSNSSGKHRGESKISCRGRKRLRWYLFLAAMSLVANSPEFKALHRYYTARAVNPLKKMQSLMAIACKLLRIIFVILKKGVRYDPNKMMRDIRRQETPTAA